MSRKSQSRLLLCTSCSCNVKVLAVDSERKRISLTTKRTLLESTLPILSKLEDVTIGLVSHAVVLKVFDKNLIVEFYNNLKATVPSRETRYLQPI